MEISEQYKHELRKDDFRHWSTDAINCYKNRCRCEDCNMSGFCKRAASYNQYNIQPMKYSVLMLFARHGEPKTI